MNDNGFERSCVRSYIDHDKIQSLRGELAERTDIERHSNLLAMLGDPTRFKILYCLSQSRELCVCDISDILDKDVSAISHQLRRLRDRGIVRNRREGSTIYYSLAQSQAWKEACRFLEKISGKAMARGDKKTLDAAEV